MNCPFDYRLSTCFAYVKCRSCLSWTILRQVSLNSVNNGSCMAFCILWSMPVLCSFKFCSSSFKCLFVNICFSSSDCPFDLKHNTIKSNLKYYNHRIRLFKMKMFLPNSFNFSAGTKSDSTFFTSNLISSS